MIKQNITFFVLFTINLTYLYAQKSVNQFDINGKRHGFWTKDYYKTNQKRYEGEFKHGKEVGTFKYYRLNKGVSVLSAIKVFNERDSIADVTFYTSSKNVISEGKMYGNRYIGKWIYYHKNSDQVMTIEHYNNQGLLHGEKLTYYKNGVLAEQSYYQQGLINGTYKQFMDSGNLLKEANYENDQLNGICVNYGANGVVESKGLYRSNRKQGIWKYYENGELKKEIDHTAQVVLKRYD